MSDKTQLMVAVTIIVLLFLALLGGFIQAIAVTNVDGYYVSNAGTGSRTGVCAYAHWTKWHEDEIAYCSDDINKVLDFVVKANTTIQPK